MKVTEIQRFCMHDGPGTRTVVFLKGCPLRCSWCHNPETQSASREILFYQQKCIGCGACAAVCNNGAHRITNNIHSFDRDSCTGCMKCTKVCCSKALITSFTEMTTDEIIAEVEKDRVFYGDSGGITLSGGEPLIQPYEALELLQKCKDRGIKTAMETCGYFDSSFIPDLVSFTDCFLWDFKDGNDKRHREYTGVSNEKIVSNLLLADSLGAKSVMRCIMVKGVNMKEDHYNAIVDLWHRLKHCKYVELIPYHAYGGSKMLALGKKDNANPVWIPAENDIQQAKQFLQKLNVKIKPLNVSRKPSAELYSNQPTV